MFSLNWRFVTPGFQCELAEKIRVAVLCCQLHVHLIREEIGELGLDKKYEILRSDKRLEILGLDKRWETLVLDKGREIQ